MFLRHASIVAISLATAAPASAATDFEVFTLQDTLGNGFSQALGINDSRQIVGEDQAVGGIGQGDPNLFNISAAMVWSAQTLTGKGLADVGGRFIPFLSSNFSVPFDVVLGINASGQAVGLSLGGNALGNKPGGGASRPVIGNPGTVLFSPSEAVVWSAQSGSGVALNDVGGEGISVANAINKAGQIAGFSMAAGGQDAVLWSASNPREATVLADVGGKGTSVANAINDSGQIVGASTANGGQLAVLWSSAVSGKALQDVGGVGFSFANAINDSGRIVGASATANGGEAVLWSASTGAGTGLTTPAGTLSDALAINDSGEVAGYTLAAGGVTDAVMWSSTGVETDLGGVLGPDWKDTEATAINKEGDIVGFGQFMGGPFNGAPGLGDTAFLLVPTSSSTPVPEASTWAMMLLGFAGLGFAGYRRARAAIPAGGKERPLPT